MSGLTSYRYARKTERRGLLHLNKKSGNERELNHLKLVIIACSVIILRVTKSNIHFADEGRYERKQTLANAERYITHELKEKESLNLTSRRRKL